MYWSKYKPIKPGWYWFEVGKDSPSRMTRLVRAVVLVGVDPLFKSKPLRAQFPQGTCHVGDMGGRWAGPIEEPKEGE